MSRRRSLAPTHALQDHSRLNPTFAALLSALGALLLVALWSAATASATGKPALHNFGHIDSTPQKAHRNLGPGERRQHRFTPTVPGDVVFELDDPSRSITVELIESPDEATPISSFDGTHLVIRNLRAWSDYAVEVFGAEQVVDYGLEVRVYPKSPTGQNQEPLSSTAITYGLTGLLAAAVAGLSLFGIAAIRKRRFGSYLANLVLLSLSLAIGLGLVEMMLRSLPSPLTFIEVPIASRSDPDVGYTFAPNEVFSTTLSCLDVRPIRTNSLGFRDDEWTEEDHGGIVVLGDSYMAAREHPDGLFLADMLEQLLDRPVINLGISGHGTIAQWRVYEKFGRPLSPRAVVLFFLITNDLSDNSAAMQAWESGSIYQPAGFVHNGSVRLVPALDTRRPIASLKPSFGLTLRRYCHLCRAIYNAGWIYAPGLTLRLFGNFGTSLKRDTQRSPYPPELAAKIARTFAELDQAYPSRKQNYKLDAYNPPELPAWRDAWQITEHAVQGLASAVRADGAELVIAAIPSLGQGRYAFDRLRLLAAESGAEFLDLSRPFASARQQHPSLDGTPGYKYRCDGHWNPYGHFLAANFLGRYLAESGLAGLGGDERRRILEVTTRNLSAGPKEALGTEAFRAIYEGEIYRGGTAIEALLQQ